MIQPALMKSPKEFSDKTQPASSWVDNVLDPVYRKFHTLRVWRPAVNIYEQEEYYGVVVDLAGICPEDINIRAEDGFLIISGKRPSPPSEFGKSRRHGTTRMHLMEIDHGQFSRKLELPDNVDIDSINAVYKQGFLNICLRKRIDVSGKKHG